MNKLIQTLVEHGWKIKTTAAPFDLPSFIKDRYSRLPVEVGEILADLEECISPDEKSWLLCLPDFCGSNEAAFDWNEFEKQSLQTAENDEAWKSEIVHFWNHHFPIYISVRDGYEYAAISLIDNTYGQVVSGREPEYEETTTVAGSFSQFLIQLTK
jgi:hypothetical protein